MRLGGLLGWRREPDEPVPAAQPLQVLRADGQRIDLGARDAGQRLVATRTGQDWQEDAWSYRDMIGELRYAHRLLARQVAKCRFYAAEIRPGDEDPIDLASTDHKIDARLAGDAVANLARLPLDDDPDGFLATLSENLSTAGESWIHGEPDGVQERWTVRSVSEIVSAGDVIMLSELPNTAMARRQIVPPQELLRCWIRHPRWGQLADSPLRAMLDDPLEEIILTGREMRAAARSRIAANGVLLIPAELSLLKDRQTEEDPTAVLASADTFMADLEAAFTAPIRNEGDPGSVVPIVLRGQAEHLKEVRHLVLQRADHEKLAERKAAAVLRMLKSLDVQPEQVEGLGGLNHWSAWVLEAKDIKQQVDPMASVLAGCLTKAMLRPALLSQHHRPDQVRRVAVLADSSGLAENPNRGQDARDAHDRLVIKDETLRHALGFDDEDAPDEDEVQRRIAAKAGIDQGTSAVVLDMLKALQESQQSKPAPMVVDAEPATRELAAGRNGAQPAGPGDRVPEKPTPTAPGRMVASAGSTVASGRVDEPAPNNIPEKFPTDGWRVDVDAARELAAIDAALADRIVTAADAAIARVLERAGNRLRTVARRDRELVASVEDLEPHLVAAVVGRDRVETYTTTSDLLSDTYGRLRGQVRSWLAEAARAVGRVVLRILGLQRQSAAGRRVHDAVVARLETRHDAAIDAVLTAVRSAAEVALYRPDPLAPSDDRGEGVSTLVEPAEVVRALAVAGGEAPGVGGGMGTGSVVAEVLVGEQAMQLGWEWQYHPGVARNAFPPHMDLDGVRVKTLTDPKLDTAPEHRSWLGGFYHPQDHKGCRCSAVPLWAAPEPGPGLERLSQLDPSIRALAESDDVAGRRGTTAQNVREVRDRLVATYIDGSG